MAFGNCSVRGINKRLRAKGTCGAAGTECLDARLTAQRGRVARLGLRVLRAAHRAKGTGGAAGTARFDARLTAQRGRVARLGLRVLTRGSRAKGTRGAAGTARFDARLTAQRGRVARLGVRVLACASLRKGARRRGCWAWARWRGCARGDRGMRNMCFLREHDGFSKGSYAGGRSGEMPQRQRAPLLKSGARCLG